MHGDNKDDHIQGENDKATDPVDLWLMSVVPGEIGSYPRFANSWCSIHGVVDQDKQPHAKSESDGDVYSDSSEPLYREDSQKE